MSSWLQVQKLQLNAGVKVTHQHNPVELLEVEQEEHLHDELLKMERKDSGTTPLSAWSLIEPSISNCCPTQSDRRLELETLNFDSSCVRR